MRRRFATGRRARSVVRSVMACAMAGLPPNPMGHAVYAGYLRSPRHHSGGKANQRCQAGAALRVWK